MKPRYHLFVLTQGRIASELIRVARQILGQLPIPTTGIDVLMEPHHAQTKTELFERVAHATTQHQALILTDIQGCTPYQWAMELHHALSIPVLTGVNLPMLMRLYNYAHCELDALIEKSLSGATQGIHCCTDHATATKDTP